VFWNADTHALRFYSYSKYRYLGQSDVRQDPMRRKELLFASLLTLRACTALSMFSLIASAIDRKFHLLPFSPAIRTSCVPKSLMDFAVQLVSVGDVDGIPDGCEPCSFLFGWFAVLLSLRGAG
jgi:hypothetical protein